MPETMTKENPASRGVGLSDAALRMDDYDVEAAAVKWLDGAVKGLPEPGPLSSDRGFTLPLMRTQQANALQKRSLSAVNLATGGTLASGETVLEAFEAALVSKSAMLRLATQVRTDDGQRLVVPSWTDANDGAQLGENTATTSGPDMTFAGAILGSRKFESGEIVCPQELVDDTEEAVVSLLMTAVAARCARALNQFCTTGSGGIVSHATSAVTAASASTVTSAELANLAESVNDAYHETPTTGFMMRSATRLLISKLTTTDGQLMFPDGARRIHGFNVFINDAAPAIATGAKAILFGDFRAAYVVRLVRAARVYVLGERKRENDQASFMAFLRGDGAIRDASAVRALTMG